MESLKKLSAANNKIRLLPDLGKCSALKELRLNGNKIMNLEVNKLPLGLQILDVSKNFIK